MKASDKLAKTSNSITLNLYDNGYMVEVTGRDSSGEWVTAQIICNSLAELQDLIAEVVEMPRD